MSITIVNYEHMIVELFHIFFFSPQTKMNAFLQNKHDGPYYILHHCVIAIAQACAAESVSLRCRGV